jgi:hypothetical protein
VIDNKNSKFSPEISFLGFFLVEYLTGLMQLRKKIFKVILNEGINYHSPLTNQPTQMALLERNMISNSAL